MHEQTSSWPHQSKVRSPCCLSNLPVNIYPKTTPPIMAQGISFQNNKLTCCKSNACWNWNCCIATAWCINMKWGGTAGFGNPGAAVLCFSNRSASERSTFDAPLPGFMILCFSTLNFSAQILHQWTMQMSKSSSSQGLTKTHSSQTF